MKIKTIILIGMLFFTPVLQGCSLLKIASTPFKNTVSKVPEKIEKVETRIKCKGQITLDALGRVVNCDDNYYYYEKTFNQQERKLIWREKIAQFFLNASGYLFWGVLLSIGLFASGFGWVLALIWNGIRGTGRALKDLVKGISSGKKYVRYNGTGYNLKEREIYNKGANDMLDKISDSIKNKNTKKIINKLRAEVD